MTGSPSFADRVHGIAALEHPLTQAAYRLLAERGELSRDQAAVALDVARSVAAFHLDKLVDAGLVDVRFERTTGRSGPGAGRTAKLYRRASKAIEVSVPERRYALAGQLLAEGVERATGDGVPVDQALRTVACETGRIIGTAARADARYSNRRDSVLHALTEHGYEPRVCDGEIVLANCPFHALAESHRALVCGMNLDLITGVIDGAGNDDVLTARLAPEQGYCCVRIKVS